MTDLFVDTSGWASLFIPTENHHKKAVSHFYDVRKRNRKLATTNYIIAELVALLGSRYPLPREKLFQYVEDLRNNSFVRLVYIDKVTDLEAWKLCKSRPDKNWSLVDSSSFIVMSQLNIQTALTTDKHFEQAGFIRLLK